MTAVIDGSTSWTASRVAANDLSNNLGSIEIIGSDCSHRLWIFIDPVHGLATYSLQDGAQMSMDPDSPDEPAWEPQTGSHVWSANQTQGGSGSVILTALTTSGYTAISATGTFAFTLLRVGTSETKLISGSFDTHSPSAGLGNGFVGGLDFEIHPTNAGHTVIADTFEQVWKGL